MRTTIPRLLAAGLLAVLLLTASAAQAGPILYTFSYTVTEPCKWAPRPCVPSFGFSFVLPDYVTTTGMFALPSPVSFASGTVPTIQSFSYAGTNNLGWWLFGSSDDLITDEETDSHLVDGPAVAFVLPSVGGYITAPTTLSFRIVSGGAQYVPNVAQSDIEGTGTITVEDSVPVPEPGSTLLLVGTGLVGLRAWRKRRQ